MHKHPDPKELSVAHIYICYGSCSNPRPVGGVHCSAPALPNPVAWYLWQHSLGTNNLYIKYAVRIWKCFYKYFLLQVPIYPLLRAGCQFYSSLPISRQVKPRWHHRVRQFRDVTLVTHPLFSFFSLLLFLRLCPSNFDEANPSYEWYWHTIETRLQYLNFLKWQYYIRFHYTKSFCNRFILS